MGRYLEKRYAEAVGHAEASIEEEPEKKDAEIRSKFLSDLGGGK